MAVILDTDLLRPHERADAVAEAMQRSGIPARVTHEPPPDQIFARIKLWQLGHGTTVMHRDGSGVCLTRTGRQTRIAAPDRISVTVLGPGRWTYTQGQQDQRVQSQQHRMLLTDQSAPYEFNRIGGGHTYSLGVEQAALGLSLERIRTAAERIESSPVYPLIRSHILQLSADLDTIPEAVPLVGNAATELVRALVVSAAEDPERQHIAMTDSLALRISLCLDQHLLEPDLTPARIAHDHHISLRQLYNVWSKDNDQTLVQWIIGRRLAKAHQELARSNDVGTISAVAHRCGFTDTAHFARKFRQAHGMSPREWRNVARNQP